LGGTWPKPGDTCPGKIQSPDIACPETDLFCSVFSRFWSGVCWGKSIPQIQPAQELTCFFFFIIIFKLFFWGSGPAFAEDFFFFFFFFFVVAGGYLYFKKLLFFFFLWRW
jgi:hypothetical protein